MPLIEKKGEFSIVTQKVIKIVLKYCPDYALTDQIMNSLKHMNSHRNFVVKFAKVIEDVSANTGDTRIILT